MPTRRIRCCCFEESTPHFAIQHYPEAKRFHDKKTAKTNGIVAIKAIAHKLARAAFHVLRDQQPFDPNKVFV
jgi:transposase